MNDERYTTPTTLTCDGDDFIIAPLPTDDNDCLRLILELQRDAAAAMLDYATRDLDPTNPYSINGSGRNLTQFDYSGDHDDYNAAAATLLMHATAALLAHTHDTARDALIEMLTTDLFLLDSITADFNTPLFDLISDPNDD